MSLQRRRQRKRLCRSLRRLQKRIGSGQLDLVPDPRKAEIIERLSGLLRHPSAWVCIAAANCILTAHFRQQELELQLMLAEISERTGQSPETILAQIAARRYT